MYLKLALWILGPFVVIGGVNLLLMHSTRRAAAMDEVELLALDLASGLEPMSGARMAHPAAPAAGATGPATGAAIVPDAREPPAAAARPSAAAASSPAGADASSLGGTLAPVTGSTAAPVPSRTTAMHRADQIEQRVDQLISDRYSHSSGPDTARFREFAATIGHDLRRMLRAIEDHRAECGTPPTASSIARCLRNELASASWWNMTQLLVLQLFLVLCLPALLFANLCKIRRAAAPGPDDSTPQARIAEAKRSRDMLQQAGSVGWFVSRCVLAYLLVLGTTYVVCPLGLKTSYLMEVATIHAVPGHASQPLWTTHFGDAPPVVIGFAGFFLYALIVALQRFFADDLDDRFLAALLGRGVVVMLLGLGLAATTLNDQLGRLFVFVAGVFPLGALEAIAKRVQVTVDPAIAGHTGTFEGLPQLNSHLIAALRSAHIESTYQLALMTPQEVAARVRIDAVLLTRLLDRALLIELAGIEVYRRLDAHGISSARQLAELDAAGLARIPEPESRIAATLRDVLSANIRPGSQPGHAAELARRLEALREWAASVRTSTNSAGAPTGEADRPTRLDARDGRPAAV